MSRLVEARAILAALALPRAQQNDRSALCLLALATLAPLTPWREAKAPLVGITPMMEWIAAHYGKRYAPNSRETIRRQTMHQFVAAGLALYNPDDPARPVNSPRAVYQLSPAALELVQTFGSAEWPEALASFRAAQGTLAQRYAVEREQARVPLQLAEHTLSLSPGAHSELTRAVLDAFGPRFAPGAKVVYVGDTEEKWAYFDRELMAALGVHLDQHDKMPDLILFDAARQWLLLVECVTSHGPISAQRHAHLAQRFEPSGLGLVFVTAFPNRAMFARYVSEIAWESEVWIAEAPNHLIHFDGERYLGPYPEGAP